MTTAIYKPKGLAAEYGEWACNLYDGCPHGCVYCYVPGQRRMSREKFRQARGVRPGVLWQLKLDLARWERGGDDPSRKVFLCFTSDPYQPLEAEQFATRRAINMAHSYGFGLKLLTKAGKLAERDFDLLGPRDEFGITLTTVDDAVAAEWEPFAAPPSERVVAMRKAAALGIPVWVSLEPVIDLAQTLDALQAVAGLGAMVWGGALNHVALKNTTPRWIIRKQLIDKAEELGINLRLKSTLQLGLEVGK